MISFTETVLYGVRNNSGIFCVGKDRKYLEWTKIEYEQERILFDNYIQEYIVEYGIFEYTRKQLKKEKTMNYSTALFLINKNLRAVLATYETGDKAPKTMFKTLDPNIKVGDYVIVPTNTRHNMTVVKVTDVDVEVDFDSDVQVELVIGTIDKTSYDQLVAQEKQALDTIRLAEAANRRDELKKKLLAHAQEQIKALPIYANGE